MKKCEKYYDILKNNGYKLTNQRKVVLCTLFDHQEAHLTVEEVYNLLKDEHPEIGLATVYRNIQLLQKLNVIQKLSLDDGFTRYELCHENEEHRHHHLLCRRCDQVIEVEDDLMESVEDTLFEKYGFLVEDHHTKFYGLCKSCRDTE